MTGQCWLIDLPYTAPPLTANQRLHWAPKAELVKQIRGDVATLARSKRLPLGLDRIEVTLHWQAPDRRRRDSDNLYPTLKACIDGLRDAGVVVDDDSTRVTSNCVVHEGPADPTLYLAVWDRSDIPAPRTSRRTA